jgi:hypothetical protein
MRSSNFVDLVSVQRINVLAVKLSEARQCLRITKAGIEPMRRVNDFAVKRTVPRFLFIAEAELTVVQNGTHLAAQLSELSSKAVTSIHPKHFLWAPSHA